MEEPLLDIFTYPPSKKLNAEKLSSVLFNLSEYKSKRDEQINQGKHDYSLLNSLLKLNSEVHLHSRFIYSMINPESLHYQGSKFLTLFLNQINHPDITDFIDITRAKVFNEYKDIDLLIHDGKNFLIIENKLTAKDQKHQITRYIQTIYKEFGSNDDLKIAVVYLSKIKTRPTFKNKEDDSLIGFELSHETPRYLVRTSEMVKTKLGELDLADGTKIPYFHLPYLKQTGGSIRCWTNECIAESKHSPEITFAFNEYKKILDRLDKSSNWRNVMNLTEFTLEQEKEKQNDIYAFMVESKKSLTDYVAQRILKEVSELLPTVELINNAESLLIKKNLSLQNIKNWFNEIGTKEKRRNVGFSYKNLDGEVVVFCLGVSRGYWGIFSEGSDFYTKDNAFAGQSSLISKLLDSPTGLPEFIKELKQKASNSKLLPARE